MLNSWLACCRTLAGAAVLVLFSMMLLTCADVIARYGFNAPISGAFELTELFLASLVFLAMPLTTLSGAHVKVELFTAAHKSALDWILRALAVIVVAGAFAVMAFEVFEHAQKLQKRGTATNSLSIPLFVIGYLVAASCAFSAIAGVLVNRRLSGDK